MPIAQLNRTVFRLSGEGVEAWLEGLITNSLADKAIIFAALLTPQGKIIADFFITREGDGFLMDTPEKFGAVLFKRLRMYKLRAPITIEDISESHFVYAVWPEKEDEEITEGLADPRLVALGRRLITPQKHADASVDDKADYNAHRLSLGVPDSAWDFETASVFPADVNMDIINGIDFKKGCFVGQEVVSRMKRMTTVKKRYRAVVLSAPAQVDDKIMAGERVIGTVVSIHIGQGLVASRHGLMAMAMIRLDRLAQATSNPTLNDNDVQIMGGPNGQN